MRRRGGYLILAVVVMLVGLAVHFHGGMLGERIRDVVGDALWATMIAAAGSAAIPRLRPPVRCAIGLAICFAVEFSQLLRWDPLDRFRASRIGHLFLGSGFDPRDLAAYALGVAVFAVVDGALTRRQVRTEAIEKRST